jgi:ssDNA-binding domain of telomere protection protein
MENLYHDICKVLQGFQNQNGVYSLYVTDYTENSGLPDNDRWGDKLLQMVLKIEMWDAAAAVGPTIVPNGFYLLTNCRMMLKGGFLEGKLVENKIKRLDENNDTENEALMKLLTYVPRYSWTLDAHITS